MLSVSKRPRWERRHTAARHELHVLPAWKLPQATGTRTFGTCHGQLELVHARVACPTVKTSQNSCRPPGFSLLGIPGGVLDASPQRVFPCLQSRRESRMMSVSLSCIGPSPWHGFTSRSPRTSCSVASGANWTTAKSAANYHTGTPCSKRLCGNEGGCCFRQDNRR